MAQIPFVFRGRAPSRPGSGETPRTEAPRSDATSLGPPDTTQKSATPVVFTVSELQSRLRQELEQRYQVVLVSGEISNFQVNARSGHAYFTLKDEGAQLKCVMWRDHHARLRHRLQDGLSVIVRGRVTIYEQGGQLQLSALSVEPRGLGARQLEFQERIEKLRKEGLTAEARKRPIPLLPSCIGLVTSKSGAALRDVLRTIYRRDPFAHVILSPSAVQGEGASSNLVRAISNLDGLGRCDVILLCRGGGSIEDLWCFNEEAVARAIVACRVPVVTGIGHETDTTIADLVADLRASTPTAAAEHAVPVRSEIRQRWQNTEAALHRALLRTVERGSRRLLVLTHRLKDPKASLGRRAQHLDELTTRGERATRARASRSRDALSRLERRLQRLDPAAKLRMVSHRLKMLEAKLTAGVGRKTASDRHRMALAIGRLEAMSPLSVLSRGYALVTDDSGRLVTRAESVDIGDALEVRLTEGHLAVRVEHRSPPQGRKDKRTRGS